MEATGSGSFRIVADGSRCTLPALLAAVRRFRSYHGATVKEQMAKDWPGREALWDLDDLVTTCEKESHP